jgi:hypothetical protein
MISTIYICCTYAGYCQVSTSYGGIDTEKCLILQKLMRLLYLGSNTLQRFRLETY